MSISSEDDPTSEAPNLEMVHWVEEENSFRTVALNEGHKPAAGYQSFEELYEAIITHGPLVVPTDMVDAIFIAPTGKFDGHLIAIRHSGRMVRRMLIRSDEFGAAYGTVQNCINHVLSNNIPECSVELKHLEDLAEEYGLATEGFVPNAPVARVEVDIIAALQLMEIFNEHFGEHQNSFEIFELGFSVGRLFSSAQHGMTLEPDAVRAREYQRSYAERGKKGKSKDRREARLDDLFEHIVALVDENSALSRLKPIEVAKLAFDDAKKQRPALWSQGGGQLESYLSTFASDPSYAKQYYRMFPKTG